MVQCLRICLPMLETRVPYLVWEDSTCHGATKSMLHSYCARELRSCNCWSLLTLSLCSTTREATAISTWFSTAAVGKYTAKSSQPSTPEEWFMYTYMLSHSVVFDSLWPHGQWSARFLCPWDYPGYNTGVGCHFLLQGIVLIQGSNLVYLYFLHWQTGSLPLAITWKAPNLKLSSPQKRMAHIDIGLAATLLLQLDFEWLAFWMVPQHITCSGTLVEFNYNFTTQAESGCPAQRGQNSEKEHSRKPRWHRDADGRCPATSPVKLHIPEVETHASRWNTSEQGTCLPVVSASTEFSFFVIHCMIKTNQRTPSWHGG